MMLSRLITFLAGVSEIAVRALPPFERARLANECRRLLRAADPPVLPRRALSDAETERTVAAARETAEPAGVLARLATGERSP